KLSSLAFGTNSGRAITLYAILPLGGAYVILKGVSHLLTLVSHLLQPREVDLLTPLSFSLSAALLFGLLHSEPLRIVARLALGLLGSVLTFLFFRLPRWILSRPSVRRVLASRPVRVAARRVLIPLALTSLVVRISPLHDLQSWLAITSGVGVFLAWNF